MIFNYFNFKRISSKTLGGWINKVMTQESFSNVIQ